MNYSYFTNNQLFILIISSIFLIVSIITFHIHKKRTALVFCVIGTFGFGFFAAMLDNFLNLWDEQYHALVAKSLVKNPFKPMLYSNPLLEYDYRNWTANHIWLHKQPLFLWQMAISLKIFGINEVAVRLPSVFLHAVGVLMVYRIGKISCNAVIGFYGALFFSVDYYLLELISGKNSTDHNDMSFLFYIMASFWAWFEYQKTKKIYWVVLIGIFSGSAILVKWLVGLLIYAVWLISIFFCDKEKRFDLRTYFPVLLAFGITILVFLPWQVYVYCMYPNEIKYELELNTKHFFQVIEGHDGGMDFHFQAINDLYGRGEAVPFLLLAGFFLFLKRITNKLYRVAILTAVVVVYAFYTLAATKMTSFTVIISYFAFLSFAALIDFIICLIFKKITAKSFEFFFRCTAVMISCFFLLDLSRIVNYHTEWKPNDNRNRKADIAQMALIKKISPYCSDGKMYVVFNASKRVYGYIAVMFYTNTVAYDFIPDIHQIQKVKAQSYKIIVVDNGNLPDFIRNDATIIKI